MELKLTTGEIVFIDEIDFDYIARWKWIRGKSGYAQRGASNKTFLMHRIIINAPKDRRVDHINGNKLDNRRSNLRLCSHQQNMFNQKRPTSNKSGYKGVTKDGDKWRASIKFNRKTTYIGRFATPEEASKAYFRTAQLLFGNFARL